jgi:hypothetical protein
MMFLGYTIFGSTAQPLILNNFHRTEDLLATAARFATGLAITFAYPLMFAGLKSSMYSLIDSASTPKPPAVVERVKGKAVVKLVPPANKLLKSSCIVAVLSVITSIAIQCGEEDVSLVLGIVGSVLGCGVAYVLPGILSLKHMRVRKAFGLKNATSDVILAHVLVAMGSFFGALGVWVTLQAPAHH